MSSALVTRLESSLAERRKDRSIFKLQPPVDFARNPFIEFGSNDYLSLSYSPKFKEMFMEKINHSSTIFGAGGARQILNSVAHSDLEARLAKFFNAPDALLTSGGYTGNVAFFGTIPQRGDFVVHDEYIHASIIDGMRAGRANLVPFVHNNVDALRETLERLVREEEGVKSGKVSVFLTVESVYSMDATVAPLPAIVKVLEDALPAKNGHLVVDEAHATGMYGPQGRGFVSAWGLEDKCLARLHTFGKALTSMGAVILTTPLIKEFLNNYGRSIIYTASIPHSIVISVHCAFDVLESPLGDQLSSHLIQVTTYAIESFRSSMDAYSLPKKILSLIPQYYRPLSTDLSTIPHTTVPHPIIPLMTEYPHELTAYLAEHGIHAGAITWPAVPKGKSRVRLIMNADITKEDVDKLVNASVAWARAFMKQQSDVVARL
ncbi:PLP-dependent transferase [Marasmius fiardii PR-910]|nr:PLP-dependent transferase [Marasmius fiardii PR-910]